MMATTTQPSTERELYLASFEREYQTTLRVLKAYPPAQGKLKFTDRSHTANEIAWTLTISQMVVEPILTVSKLEPMPMPAPDDFKAILAQFEKAHGSVTAKLKTLDDKIFNSPITLPVGPGGATGSVRRADALWMMLSDTIHHRGQFSVYLRAAGGKVPSIYGGSGDEPWM
jgi:uncharacterized damage-inducible protein DinB